MNIQNNRAAEVLYSTTYVEDYLDTVDNLPEEMQRLLSRLLTLDVDARKYCNKVRDYFVELGLMYKRNSRTRVNEELDREIARMNSHITVTLMKSQDIGDEKIQVAQQIQDFVDNRLRQLEIDRKTLDSVQKQADAAEAFSSRETQAQRNSSSEASMSISTSSERTIKRVRRVRLGPSIIPKTGSSTVSSANTSSSHQVQQSTSLTERRQDPSLYSTAPRSSSLAQTVPSIEKEKSKTSLQTPAVDTSKKHETTKDKEVTPNLTSSNTTTTSKKKSIDSESSAPEQRDQDHDSSDRKTETKSEPRTPRKKEKRLKQQQQQHHKSSERKQSSVSTSTRMASTKRKARQMEEDDDDSLPGGSIDPNEPIYCLCDQISYGEMIGCDNDLCPIEWFHFSCVSLTTKPKGKWFCPNCRGDRPNIMKSKDVFLKELDQYNKKKTNTSILSSP